MSDQVERCQAICPQTGRQCLLIKHFGRWMDIFHVFDESFFEDGPGDD